MRGPMTAADSWQVLPRSSPPQAYGSSGPFPRAPYHTPSPKMRTNIRHDLGFSGACWGLALGAGCIAGVCIGLREVRGPYLLLKELKYGPLFWR